MGEDSLFFQSYRQLIETYRLAPDISAMQLAQILRRVRAAQKANMPFPGNQSVQSMTKGGGWYYDG